MLASATLTPRIVDWNASFKKALPKFAARYAPIPYSRTCIACAKPIFSADSTATETPDGWTHAGCQPEPVISGAETNGDDSHDPHDTNRPTEQELDELYLTVTGWQKLTQNLTTETIWIDPLSGLAFWTENALTTQSNRDMTGWSFTG